MRRPPIRSRPRHLPFRKAALKPVYETAEGWHQSTRGARSWADLSATAIKYIVRVEELIGAPVALLSTSPEREDTVLVRDRGRRHRRSVHAGLGLIAAHAASRAVLPVAMRAITPARADGLGVEAGRPSASVATATLTIGVLIRLAALGPIRGAIALGAASAAVFASSMLAQRRIGGYTGDVLGAFQQIGEIVMLLTATTR